MMLTWKYTLPAFVVPFVFTLTAQGSAILLRGPVVDIVTVTASAALGIAAFAVAFGGWIVRPANPLERVLAGAAGALLTYAAGWADLAGLALLSLVLFLHMSRRPLKAGG